MEETKEEMVEKCQYYELKPHPVAVMKRTVKYMKQGYGYEEARKKAEEEALAEGLYHGMTKLKAELCELVMK